MGWSTGSQIFEEITGTLRSNVPDFADRVDIYKDLITIFENYGAELHDVYGVDDAFDEAWKEIYGSEEDE